MSHQSVNETQSPHALPTEAFFIVGGDLMSVLAESTQPQFSSPLSDTTSPDPQFPLRLSANGRYLVDSIGDPFMLKQFSAWCLMQAISETDAAAHLDSLKGKGSNTLMASVISNAPSQMGGNPPYWQGISPFTTEWDFSTPNEDNFPHVDRVLKMAEQKGAPQDTGSKPRRSIILRS